jgi:hypothetical protein
LLRSTDRPDQSLASVDAKAGQGVDGGAPGDIVAVLHVAVASATCGDQLVLRTKMVSGSSSYLEFLVTLTTP